MSGEVLRPTAEVSHKTFTETLQFWTKFLAEQPIETCHGMAGSAVSQLDGLLEQQGVLDEVCIVNGEAQWSEILAAIEEDPTAEGPADEQEIELRLHIQTRRGRLVGRTAICRGFAALGLAEGNRPQLFYQFETDRVEVMPQFTMLAKLEHYFFVEPEGSSVVPASTFEEPFIPYQPGDAIRVAPEEALTAASWQLVKLVSSTAFRRQKRWQQQQDIDGLIGWAEANSLVKGADVLVEPCYGYLSEPTLEGLLYEPLALDGLCISGICLGLTMLGRERLRHKAIRRDSDLWSKHEGLVMSVELGEAIAADNYQLDAGTIIHLPISSQLMECAIVPDREAYPLLREEEEAA